jgi:hypothetical protein
VATDSCISGAGWTDTAPGFSCATPLRDPANRSSSRLDGLARFSEVAKPQPSLPATAVSEKSM